MTRIACPFILLLFGGTALGCGAPQATDAPESPETGVAGATGATPEHLPAALAAAAWIRSTAVEFETGTGWPADPYDTASVVTNLYTGTPGVVLFFLELAAHTGDDSYLQDARAGADFLLARMNGPMPTGDDDTGEPVADPTMQAPGLYTGLAGVGFVLNETYRATGSERYRQGAMQAVEMINEQAREAGASWLRFPRAWERPWLESAPEPSHRRTCWPPGVLSGFR